MANLSTHDLTQRSTFQCRSGLVDLILSTHDLTQRSTLSLFLLIPTPCPFNSRPHAEVDKAVS